MFCVVGNGVNASYSHMRYIVSHTSRRGNNKDVERAEPWRTDVGDCEWLQALKKNEIRASVETRIEVEMIILSKSPDSKRYDTICSPS